MRKINYKGRCEKRSTDKCKSVCRLYDPIQSAYLDQLIANPDITDINCNFHLDDDLNEYMTDFLCTKADGTPLVRECVVRRLLSTPLTIKLLDLSRCYWLRHGVEDWGIVTNAETNEE